MRNFPADGNNYVCINIKDWFGSLCMHNFPADGQIMYISVYKISSVHHVCAIFLLMGYIIFTLSAECCLLGILLHFGLFQDGENW